MSKELLDHLRSSASPDRERADVCLRPCHRSGRRRLEAPRTEDAPMATLPREAGIRLRSRGLRVSADGVGAATTSDEPRRQDGPAELNRGGPSVARPDFPRSDGDSNWARYLSPSVEAIPRCFEAQALPSEWGAATRSHRGIGPAWPSGNGYPAEDGAWTPVSATTADPDAFGAEARNQTTSNRTSAPLRARMVHR